MPSKPRRRTPVTTHPYGVVIATGICLALLLLILLHPQLRNEDFGQKLAGMIIGLLVAIILFSLFPPTAGVPIAIGTAAGFYLFLFPKIQTSLFPTREILGTVTYQGSQRGVPGVIVRVTNSGQEDTTNRAGEFVLRRVAPDSRELRFSVEQFDTVVAVSRKNVYPIVPFIRSFETLSKTVPSARWRRARTNACPRENGPSQLYILETLISADTIAEPELRGRRLEEGLLAHLRLSPRGGVRIVDAQSLGPLPGWDDNPAVERPNWKWTFPLGLRRSIPIRIEVCYVPDDATQNSEPPFETTTWIQGRYRDESSTR